MKSCCKNCIFLSYHLYSAFENRPSCFIHRTYFDVMNTGESIINLKKYLCEGFIKRDGKFKSWLNARKEKFEEKRRKSKSIIEKCELKRCNMK